MKLERVDGVQSSYLLHFIIILSPTNIPTRLLRFFTDLVFAKLNYEYVNNKSIIYRYVGKFFVRLCLLERM